MRHALMRSQHARRATDGAVARARSRAAARPRAVPSHVLAAISAAVNETCMGGAWGFRPLVQFSKRCSGRQAAKAAKAFTQ